VREVRRPLLAIRVSIVATSIAVILGICLLFKETPYVFSAFMMLGPLLLAIAFVLMAWVILAELKASKVL
jgi:hypothetical protein